MTPEQRWFYSPSQGSAKAVENDTLLVATLNRTTGGPVIAWGLGWGTSIEGCTDLYRLDTDCHKVSGDLGPLSEALLVYNHDGSFWRIGGGG